MKSLTEKTSLFMRIGTVLVLLLLTIYIAFFYVPKSSLELNQEAYASVISCALDGDSSKARLKFEEISFVVVPQRKLVFREDDKKLELSGWFNPADSTIYVPKVNSRVGWLLRHEFAHAVGFSGHPDFPFKTCGWVR